MTRFASRATFLAALADMPRPDAAARDAALAREAILTKPAGALGRLEDIAVFMAAWQCRERPRADHVQAVVFAGNHGVAAQGVSAFPAQVTAQMVANFAVGGAAINALTQACGARLSVRALDLDRPTGDISREAAMSEEDCLAALNEGADALDPKADLLLVGEMGIANTTPAAALCAHSFGEPAHVWTGRGSGIDDAALNRKEVAVRDALVLHGGHCTDPFETLRRLGGREIAAMAGAILAARMARIPVLLDGFIACASIAPLFAAVPGVVDHCIAGHCSAEGGHPRLLDRMGLEPLLRLGLRLGEGSGAALAVPIVKAALATHNHMATFAEAAVSQGVPAPA